MEVKTANVLGYPIARLTYNEALKYVVDYDGFMQIVTINPEMIELAQKNQEFSEVLKSAQLVIPDGVGVKIALMLHGIKQEQIAGCEFSKSLIEKASQNGESIALLGAKQEVLDLCAQKLLEEFPTLKISFSDVPSITLSIQNSIAFAFIVGETKNI